MGDKVQSISNDFLRKSNEIENSKLVGVSWGGWSEVLIFLGGLLSFDLIFIESRNDFSRLEKNFYRFENFARETGRDFGGKF